MKRRDLAAEWTPHDSVRAGAVPQRRAGVHGVELDHESVLYDAGTDRLHLLNWSASAVWWSIDGCATADDLAQKLADRFQTDGDVMATDVHRLLEVLGAQRLVDAVRTPEAAR